MVHVPVLVLGSTIVKCLLHPGALPHVVLHAVHEAGPDFLGWAVRQEGSLTHLMSFSGTLAWL